MRVRIISGDKVWNVRFRRRKPFIVRITFGKH